MINLDRDICFVDTETLGLDPAAPVWEFAALRLHDYQVVDKVELQILHQQSNWLDSLPQQFADDYRNRFDIQLAVPTRKAAQAIAAITDGAVIAGSNPTFDIERLTTLLATAGKRPGWHYHPLDIPSMAVGYLARMVLAHRDLADQLPVEARWSSDAISRRIGVNPDDYARHTAMGDVKWCLAQWKAMNADDLAVRSGRGTAEDQGDYPVGQVRG